MTTPRRRRADAPSPPAKIDRGIATNVGLGGIAGSVAAAIADALVTGKLDADAYRFLRLALILAVVVIVCRSAQAIAVELVRGRQADDR